MGEPELSDTELARALTQAADDIREAEKRRDGLVWFARYRRDPPWTVERISGCTNLDEIEVGIIAEAIRSARIRGDLPPPQE